MYFLQPSKAVIQRLWLMVKMPPTTFFCIALAISLWPNSKAAYTCPKDWRVFDGNCYNINSTARVTWHMARDICEGLNATLSDIRSKAESDFLKDKARFSVWIGLHDIFGEGEFHWVDSGDKDIRLNFTNWLTGEPNNASESCAVVNWHYPRKGKWNDKYCNLKYKYICEKGSTASGCGKDWKPFTGKCYKFETSKMVPWQEARDNCKMAGGDLVTIMSDYERRFIANNIKSSYWIGLHKVKGSTQNDDKWVWLDNTSETPYKNWDKGEPNNANNGRENCMAVHSESRYRFGKWFSYACQISETFMCEKPAVQGNCPAKPSWKKSGDSCFFCNVTDYKSWTDARKACKSLGGDLAVFTNSSHQEFLLKALVQGSYTRSPTWVGLRFVNNQWTWVDGSTISSTNFSSWSSGEPANRVNPDENCVVIHSSIHNRGSWDNVDCKTSRSYGYICELSGVTCDNSWFQYGGHCYKFNPDVATWSDARGRCKRMHKEADLVIIDDLVEQHFIEDKLKVTSWIGLNAVKTAGTFVWLDTKTQPIFKYWGYREPNLSADEACVEMYGGYSFRGLWKDSSCNKQVGYLCKAPAGGFPSYYDFKYKESVYELVNTKMPRHTAELFCKEVFGKSSGLAVIETEDEMKFLIGELKARFGTRAMGTFTGSFWIGDEYAQNGTMKTFAKWDYNYPQKSYGKSCLILYGGRYNILTYKLRNIACCIQNPFICEKKVGNDTKYYDFAHKSSMYTIVTKQKKDPKSANDTCENLLSGGYLAQIDSLDELTSIGKEIAVRHHGKELQYWIGGNPQMPTFKINWAVKPQTGDNCIYLGHANFNSLDLSKSNLQMYSSKCTGEKTFICERKMGTGENIVTPVPPGGSTQRIVGPSDQTTIYDNSCRGACIGLAVALPITVIIAVVITVFATIYFRRVRVGMFSFHKATDEVYLDVDK